MTERLVGVDEWLYTKQAVGHISDDTNNGEPRIPVLRHVRTPPKPLSNRILSWPERPR